MVAHAAVFGTGHSYLTALLALDPAMVRDWAAEQGRTFDSLAQLAHDDELIQTVALSIAYANRDLSPEQRVRAFTVVGEEWVRGSALLSFDSTPRRAAIAERYAADLEAMFDGDPYVAPDTAGSDIQDAGADDHADDVADPTIPPFVTEQHTVAPRPAPPTGPPAGRVPAAPTAPDDLVDPTPSWSAVLRPGRPLAPKDTEARPSQRPAAPANARQDNPGPAAGGGQNGNGPNDGDWDDSWQEPAPPARRWWWAVLVALVVVAAGALVLKTTNNDSSDDASLTTEVVDTTPDTMFEDPDATDPVVDTTPDTSVAPVATDSLLVTAERTNSLATFLAAVKAAGLDTDLAGPGPYTVFAPTDDAFNKLDPEVLKALLADKDLLTKILRHHMVDGAVNAEDLTEGNLTALDGTTILVATATDITLDKTVRPVDTDIAASNGVLHTIDTVLLPPDMDPTALLPTTTTLPSKLFFTVYFGTQTRVLDDAAKAEIASAAAAIKSFPAGSEVVITGHTLKSGTVGHRKFIAKLRATTVINALKKAGATNVTYRIVTVINLPLSGDRVAARRTEITLPGYDPAAASTSTTTSTSMPSSTTTTTTEAP